MTFACENKRFLASLLLKLPDCLADFCVHHKESPLHPIAATNQEVEANISWGGRDRRRRRLDEDVQFPWKLQDEPREGRPSRLFSDARHFRCEHHISEDHALLVHLAKPE
jgi:hypothetical protein